MTIQDLLPQDFIRMNYAGQKMVALLREIIGNEAEVDVFYVGLKIISVNQIISVFRNDWIPVELIQPDSDDELPF